MFNPLTALTQWWTNRQRPVRKANMRMYAMGKPGRTTSGWGAQTTSEDNELSTSLRLARQRSRELMRDAAYAKRAKVIVQNNIIGSGIGLQAKVETSRGTFNNRVNDAIEAAWKDWCEARNVHTGQALHFHDMQRLMVGECFEAGECFIRLHAFAQPESQVPLALEVIEPERLADELSPGPVSTSSLVKLGVEVNQFGAAVAYFVRTLHPGERTLQAGMLDRVERVPASEMLHLRLIDRWPQTRAIPWIHAAARKLNDMDGLTEAEITAARGAACYMGFIETPDGETTYGEDQADGSVQAELEPAIVEKLAPGEKFNAFAPNRPNTQLDPFMRMMLREVASGVGCSYESLSRDYSQSNYSSSRLALLDDRDLWRMLQSWYIRSVMTPIYRTWLRQAVLAGAIEGLNRTEYALNPRKFEAACFKPRGWSWIDPTKEVAAYKDAIRCGFTTVSAVIAATGEGRDLEEVLKERARELELMEEYDLTFDTDTTAQAPPETNAATPPAEAEPPPEEEPASLNPTVTAAEKMLQQAGRTHGQRKYRFGF